MDLSTQYLGLALKNPLIVGSSGLTQNVDKIKACEAAGAGAVVMKSLFEEQIRDTDSGIQDSAMMHPEAMNYIQADLDMLYGPHEYIQTIEKAKKAVSIPVIASVNCFTSKWWVSYAQQLEAAGADAIELNTYVFPIDLQKSGADLEQIYCDILKAVKSQVKIPVVLKISPYFTALGNFAARLAESGADSLVLFNRYVQPDIDINHLQTTVNGSFTDPQGFYHSLRWIALLSGKLNLDWVASGGVHEAEDVIKQLLAGAAAVQITSVLYMEGLPKIQKILQGLEAWMREQKFKTIAEFSGRLNQINNPQSLAYIRAQYIKKIAGVE
jgi:dihydroorotate dehydrogenase (fumarate)